MAGAESVSRTVAPTAAAPSLVVPDPITLHADSTLQRRDLARGSAPNDASRYNEARSTVHVVADIVQRKSRAMIPSAPQPQQQSLYNLYDNVVGRSLGQKLSGAHRLVGLELALEDLDTDMALVESDPQGRRYVADEIDHYLTDLRAELRFCEAQERSDRAVNVGGKTIEKSSPDPSAVDLSRPGSYQILHEIFRPLVAYRGKTSRDDLLAAAQMALQVIGYSVANTEMILLHATQGHDLTEMQDDITKRREKARKAREEEREKEGGE